MEDAYGDDPEMEKQPAVEGADNKVSEPEAEEADTTALIPKTLFAGKDFKPGDEIVLKIEHLYEDEAEVSYAKEKAGGKKASR